MKKTIIEEFRKEFGTTDKDHPDYHLYAEFEQWLDEKLSPFEQQIREETALEIEKILINEKNNHIGVMKALVKTKALATLSGEKKK